METINNNKKHRVVTVQNYKIEGMTCSSCVEKITQKLKIIPNVSFVEINLKEKKAKITADRHIQIEEVRNAIVDMPNYTVDLYDDVPAVNKLSEQKSFYQTYKPLITLFAYILFFSLAYQLKLGHFSEQIFMNHLMAGFFIGLSFFKFLDLKSFATTFSNYDLIAKRWKSYGVVYPFIELTLGFLFISGQFLQFANAVTVAILGVTTVGVYYKIKTKSLFQCACLGTAFNLPLSNVTIAENLTMIAMTLYRILSMI